MIKKSKFDAVGVFILLKNTTVKTNLRDPANFSEQELNQFKNIFGSFWLTDHFSLFFL